MSNIKSRLARLEAATNPPEIVLLPITPDITDAQAAQTYRDSMRLFNAGYVHPAPRDHSEPEISAEDYAAHLYDTLESFCASRVVN